jgi:type IV secretion system protein VirB10
MPEEKLEPEDQPQPTSVTTPALRDKRVLPEGVVPKQAQSYVIAGLSLLILFAVLFSKNHPKPAPPAMPGSTAPYATESNARRIEELKETLNTEQRQAQTQRMNTSPGTTGNTPAAEPLTNSAGTAPQSATVASEPPRDPLADAERELAFKARFASNLITSDARASRLPAASDSGTAAALSDATTTAVPSSLSLRAVAPAQSVSATKRAPEVTLNSAHGQPFVLFEGTTIDTVLTNRLNGEFIGAIKVMVSNPTYSHDGQHVLIPEGTFILGNVQKVAGFGQKRLAVTFHRMLMPDGYSVDLDQFPGLDQIGQTGLKGKIDNHYMEIFGASIALGIIAGAAEATTNGGYNQSGSDAYRQGIASSMSQASNNVLDRFINIPPTHTIYEGNRVKVYLTQDMLLPAYENHTMPGVF